MAWDRNDFVIFNTYILNKMWYVNLLRGKYNKFRILQTVIKFFNTISYFEFSYKWNSYVKICI